jgi:DedD protein
MWSGLTYWIPATIRADAHNGAARTHVDLRNLDQIQEQDGGSSRGLGPWLLGAGGVAAIVLAMVMSMPEKHVAAESTEDPLAELLAKAKEETEAAPADQLSPDNASFAQILTDKERPSTALVAVKASNGRLIDPAAKDKELAERQLPAPPPPADQLPVVPLPVGKLLDSTKLTAEPEDGLAGLAAEHAQLPPGSQRAEAGSPGEYQIQVAAFPDKKEADAYVEELRLRGHRAHAVSALLPNRGVWYRVRIGPFKDKLKALAYKAEFEQKESMAALLIDPEKVERQQAQRAAKYARVKVQP